MHKEYIEPVIGVESLTDALLKLGQEDMVAQEVEMAQQALQAAQEKQKVAEQQRVAPDPHLEPEAKIEGQDMEGSTPPTEQPGAELPAEAPIPMVKTWFMDNFGMTGRELSEILIKSNELKILDSIQPLLKMEKQAILGYFIGVSPSLVDDLPLTDMDYDALNKHSDRLDLAFRRFVKSWTTSNDDGKVLAEELWSTTIDKSERLSNRERNLLQKCRDVLVLRGALNAQTLKTYGIQASPAEISSLIKSHGFLFDLISVGQFSKSVGRGLFYDVKRRDVLLKDADQFLAGLIENGAKFKLDSMLNPRIELPFYAPTAPWYADALVKAVDSRQIVANNNRIIVDGEVAVTKVLEMAEPYFNGHAPDARKLLKGLKGDTDALLVLAYENMKSSEQMALLKVHRLTHDDMEIKREEVVANG